MGRLDFDMPRYAAFLRGVMPMNCKMPALKAAFEAAGFSDVKTVLGSGNVVFDARSTSQQALQQKAEAAMQEHLGQAFLTIVRPIEQLRTLDAGRRNLQCLSADPQGSRLHEPDREDVRQGPNDAYLGYDREGGAVSPSLGFLEPFDELHLTGVIDRVTGDPEYETEALRRRHRRRDGARFDRGDKLSQPLLLRLERGLNL